MQSACTQLTLFLDGLGKCEGSSAKLQNENIEDYKK